MGKFLELLSIVTSTASAHLRHCFACSFVRPQPSHLLNYNILNGQGIYPVEEINKEEADMAEASAKVR